MVKISRRSDGGKSSKISFKNVRYGSQKTVSNDLKPKSNLRVGCWNVRTLYQPGKLKQVLGEMENYNIKVLCVSEARCINSGRRRLSSGYTILFSGRTDNHHSNGVAIIVKRMVEKTILGWKRISDRLLKVRFNSRFVKMTVIVCYASTEEAEDEMKEEFYEQLEEAIPTTPQHGMLLVNGHFNARVGMDNTGKLRKEQWVHMALDTSTITVKDSWSCVRRTT